MKKCQKSTAELKEYLGAYKGKEYKKTVIIPNLRKVAKLIAKLDNTADCNPSWNQEDKELCAALKLVHDAIIAKEMSRRPSQLALCQGQRDGLDCMNFFFDLINDCAGYTSKYYEEMGAGKLNYN